MDFTDQTLTCVDCGQSFVWTADQQKFYQDKGFQNSPKRCPTCRQAKKDQRMTQRQMTKIVCSECGKPGEVPFVPRGDSPVLCQDCFKKRKPQ